MGGLELISVCGSEVVNPEASIPRAALISTTVAFIFFISMVFVCVSLPEGLEVFVSSTPIASGLLNLFPSQYALAMALGSVGALTALTPWLFGLTRVLHTLALKGLAPRIFATVSQGVPIGSLLISFVVSIAIVAIVTLIQSTTTTTIIYTLSNLGSILTNIWALISFILLRINSPTLHRSFISPFGLPGAVLGIAILVTVFVFNCLANSKHVDVTFYVLIACFVIWSAYYYFVSIRTIVLDEDEKKAVIALLDVNTLLKTEHGFTYLEKHCLKELNPESLYCLQVSVTTTISAT